MTWSVKRAQDDASKKQSKDSKGGNPINMTFRPSGTMEIVTPSSPDWPRFGGMAETGGLGSGTTGSDSSWWWWHECFDELTVGVDGGVRVRCQGVPDENNQPYDGNNMFRLWDRDFSFTGDPLEELTCNIFMLVRKRPYDWSDPSSEFFPCWYWGGGSKGCFDGTNIVFAPKLWLDPSDSSCIFRITWEEDPLDTERWGWATCVNEYAEAMGDRPPEEVTQYVPLDAPVVFTYFDTSTPHKWWPNEFYLREGTTYQGSTPFKAEVVEWL